MHKIFHKDDENRTHNAAPGATSAIGLSTPKVIKKPAKKITISKSKEQDLYKQAAENYAKKLKMERPLYNKVNDFLKNINNEFKSHYSKTGIIPNISDKQKQLESILNDHHVKVANSFSNNIRNKLGNPSNNDHIQRKLEANIKGYAAQRSHLMSHKILDTTKDNIDKTVKDINVSLALAGKDVTDENVAKMASNSLTSRFVGRSNIISITETQIAAETGKSLEYKTMDDFDVEYDDKPISDIVGQKMWVAILDDHTRSDHAEADGQMVDKEEPYDVGGEQLMIPGDDSLGASEENIINCRCSSEDVIND